MSTDSESIPELHPRDILQPIATLIGLLVAAVGFLYSAKLPTGTFQGLIVLIGIVIFFFVITAISTSLFFSTGFRRFWTASLWLYPVSWAVFGTGILFVLIEVAFGPISVHLPSLPAFNLSSLLPVVLGILGGGLGIIAEILFRRSDETKLDKVGASLRASLATSGLPTESEVENLISLDNDYQMAFVKVTIQLETLIRNIAERTGVVQAERASLRDLASTLLAKGVIGEDIYDPLMLLWSVRNRIVHGRDVSSYVAREGVTAALKIKKTLEDIQGRQAAQA